MRLGFPLTLAIAMASGLALSGCNTPRGSGSATQILKGAEDETADYAVLPITRDTVGTIADWPGTGGGTATSGWLPRKRGPSGNAIAPGDRLDLAIWEAGDATLLATPGQKLVSLQGLTVSGDGTIYLPYAENVYVANMTADEARLAVQQKLDVIMPSAEVLLTHQPGRQSTVDLVSGVPRPGTFPMPDRDFTILALIAQGGGIPESMPNPYVRLMRDGKLYGISADRLLKDPSLDTTLRGGDKVFVEADERYFLALGATGREAQIPFTQERITALDALSLIGGLNEGRADAKGILILRNYSSKSVRSDGSGPPKDRMIFAIDMTTADGLFSAGEFHIHNKDVVLVTESPLGTTASILSLVGSIVGIGRTAQVIATE